MPTNTLDNNTLHGAIIRGCHQVVNQKNALNAINFFPVADGDTGDNMAATASAIISFSRPEATLSSTLQSIADASIMGAHGNSGMIFSQFFNALIHDKLPEDHISISDFSTLLRSAANGVRASILNPVEGTILTIIEAWASNVNRLATDDITFQQVLNDTQPLLQDAVTSTSRPINKEDTNCAVDAGALGFYHFTNGFTQFLDNPEAVTPTEEAPALPLSGQESHIIEEKPQHRYCTEALFQADAINTQTLTAELSRFGDSVVLTANSRLCRFHLHTNDPSQVFKSLMSQGVIKHPKIDDMQRQFECLHARKQSIALVTDSGADIPQSLRDHYQIHNIPLNIHLDEHHFLDRNCFDPNEFYNALPSLKSWPRTSFPAKQMIDDKIRHLASQYDHVLIISLSQVLSGLHDAFVNVAKTMDNVHVLNSCLSSGAQGLLVLKAAELIEQGEPIERIKTTLEQQKGRIYFFAMITDVDALVRSGRIGKFAGGVARFSHIKPIISLDRAGKGVFCTQAFSERAALGKLTSLVDGLRNDQGMTLDRYSIVHAGVEDKAREYSHITRESLQQDPLFIEPVSTAIGLHGGKGCVGIAAMMAL